MRNESKPRQRKPRTKPATPPLEVLRAAELVPTKYLALLQPAFTEPSLRWHLFNRAENGLAESGAVVEIGGRVLWRPSRFAAWLESKSQRR